MADPTPATADMTLDELRIALAPEIARAAVFDGWSETALAHAAEMIGADPMVARIAFADGAGSGGPMAMITAWIATIDAAMSREYADGSLSSLPIRERIRRLIAFRLDALAGLEEAVSRALSVMALPQHVAQGIRLGWHTADIMWRLAGDRATDYNHYTKRATLAAVYGATLAVFTQDRSADKAETHAFLARRIDGVMRFEKAKARLSASGGNHFSVSRFLGRLRYPAT